jgi:hypothetical protein
MGGSKLAPTFVNDPLCSKAKGGLRAPVESLEMSLDRSLQQTVVGVEKDQKVAGASPKAEVSGRRAAGILCTQNQQAATFPENGTGGDRRPIIHDYDLNVGVRLSLDTAHSLGNESLLLVVGDNH